LSLEPNVLRGAADQHIEHTWLYDKVVFLHVVESQLLDRQAHIVPLDKETNLNIFAYNFSDISVSGTITAEYAPQGCKLTPDRWEITLEPMGRKRLTTRFSILASKSDAAYSSWFKLRGEFANAGRPVLAFRLVPK